MIHLMKMQRGSGKQEDKKKERRRRNVQDAICIYTDFPL